MNQVIVCDDREMLVKATGYITPRPKAARKVIYTLRIGDYAPEICSITYPLLRAYAHKIGADFETITKRRWPDFPPVYEKLQIYDLAQDAGNLWSIYIDSDTLIHPDMFDVTDHLDRKTVCHNGKDMAGNRWRYDRFFRRDGRHIGSCNWFAVASDWCVDLWRPLDDLTLEEAISNIFPTVDEQLTGCCKPEHLIDDYTLSRNIAKFGLRHTTVTDIQASFGLPPGGFFHIYNVPEAEKIVKMKQVLKDWKLA
jgi:hypothetical protein